MDEATKVAETIRYAEQIVAAARQRKLIAETWHGDWLVRSYFGPTPGPEDGIPRITYSACAVTMNVESGPPDLHDSDAIRVDFDSRSVVWMSAETRPLLTQKLKQVFRGFRWSPTERT